ncbi:TPA: YggU family protein, partial [Candidatus Spyradomonas excrementavium]|nr:YggU family protein [Candidatus Spyradomonas excrementavium]
MCIFFKEKDNGVLLNIKAVPNSSKNEICGVMENALKVKIKAPAVENKANLELVKYFSKLLKVQKSSISLVSGSTSKI